MRSLLIAIGFYLITATLHAQEYVAGAALPVVKETGFYKVSLSPALSPYLNTSFSNFRIVDGDGKHAPYVVWDEIGVRATDEFVPYTIEDKQILKDSCTVVVVSNTSRTSINNIHLIIKNAAVVKEARLYGSDDKETWYALKDTFTLGYVADDKETSEISVIDFPASDYAYFKLCINDKKNGPLNIQSAGYYKTIPGEFSYDEVPTNGVKQVAGKNSEVTHIRILLDTFRIVEKLTWNVSGVPFYQRSATVYTIKDYVDRKGRTRSQKEIIAAFEINSRHENVLYLPIAKVNNLQIDIVNGDNPPLNVEEIKLYQSKKYLLAWLEKDEQYSLKFGTDGMQAAEYDLQFFKDNIAESLGILEPSEVTFASVTDESPSPTLFTRRAIIWLAIGIVVVVLAFMSVKMVRESKAVGDN